MKYKDYTLEDFLADKEFISWIINPVQESDKFWKAVIQEHPEKREVFEKAIKFARMIHFSGIPSSQKTKDRILANTISLRYSTKAKSQNTDFKNINWVLATNIAAIIILLITILFTVVTSKWIDFASETTAIKEVLIIDKQNPAGRKSQFQLPDGSLVKLNAESKLTFPQVFGDKREVWLNGEASFEVEENQQKSFLVHTKNLTVLVKGTIFNVKAFSNEVHESVSLLSGKVSILCKEVEQLENYELIPGEMFSLDLQSNQLTVSDINMDEVVWSSGILVFKNDNLDTFIKKIQRWYGVSVETEGYPKEEIKINGKFDNESLENVLESLKFSIGIDYKLINSDVQINF